MMPGPEEDPKTRMGRTLQGSCQEPTTPLGIFAGGVPPHSTDTCTPPRYTPQTAGYKVRLRAVLDTAPGNPASQLGPTGQNT